MNSRLRLAALLAAAAFLPGSDCSGNLGSVTPLALSTHRVSVRADASQANGGSNPNITADGRYVFFDSDAFDLVGGDTNNVRDVFRKDRFTGEIMLVSTDGNGNLRPKPSQLRAISTNGRFVLIHYDTPGPDALQTEHGMLYVKDLQATFSSNQVVLDPALVFQYDLQGGAVSEDGLSVVFQCYTQNFPGITNAPQYIQIYLSDLSVYPPTLKLVSSTTANGNTGGNNYSTDCDISGDGQSVVFGSSATNLQGLGAAAGYEIFLWHRAGGTLEIVSKATDGTVINGGTPTISVDGRYVAFETAAAYTQPMRVGVRDLIGLTTQSAYDEAVAQPPPMFLISNSPQLGKGGRHVLFNSTSDLLDGPSFGVFSIFVRNLDSGGIVRASVNNLGQPANTGSFNASISADGRWVLWNSFADNLVGGDTNVSADVFVRGPYEP